MNVKEGIPVSLDANVYTLVTELSKHILLLYGRSVHQNTLSTYDCDIKSVKHLRSKAFEILLKKTNPLVDSQDSTKHAEIDPVLQIQKHAFALRIGLNQVHDATLLEHLLDQLKESLFLDTTVSSVLQLLVHLKNFSIKPEPITNIFYYGKTNPALPEMAYISNDVPLFQLYPMECFIQSDQFQATLNTQHFQTIHGTPKCAINRMQLLHGTAKIKSIRGTEPVGISSILPGIMSSHVFDGMESSYAVKAASNRYFIKSRSLESRENMLYEKKEENDYAIHWEKSLLINYLYGFSQCTEAISVNSESIVDTWKSNNSIVDEVNCCSTRNTWNPACSHFEITDIPPLDYQTWECFGELQSSKELNFLTDLPTAAIYLEKIEQMSSLPLLSEKVINSIPLLEELSVKEFMSDLKLMLLGIESNSFEYNFAVGFTLRKCVSVYGVCSKSLEKTCQEAVNWGNCFKFLSQLVTPKSQNDRLSQEGLIFKALCTNIKELLLYYRSSLLRIFTHENKSDGLLNIFERVRPVAVLIIKVAKLCDPYKQGQCIVREGSSILTRIYNEAIKVTDTKMLFSVARRFLQKWMFEGICDDIYGEFMIKTRPQYLRSRGHKFWSKSFSVCNEAVPGFLNDLAESILQCGKTVRLLRICNSKNSVCHVCLTEQPEVRVCLSVTTLREQSLRCEEYEKKGKSALGAVLSLSTAIQSFKESEKGMAEENVIRAQRDALSKIRNEREDALRKLVQTKRNSFTCFKDQIPEENVQREKTDDRYELSNEIESEKQRNESLHTERTRALNFNEDLISNGKKGGCLRSEWRAKRIAFHDKRISALILANQDYLESDEKASSLVKKLSSLIETPPVSFEDENKNYTNISDDRTCSKVICDTLIDSSREFDRQNVGKTNNNNECNDFHNYRNATGISMNSESNDDTLRNETICRKQRTLIERPNFLNVTEINNLPIDTNIYKIYAQTFEYDMTPNNNELDVQRIRFTPEKINDARRDVEDLRNIHEKNTNGTPMSCTTDNFTLSIHSPTSQTQNPEDQSPMEISTTDMLSSSCVAITRSPLPIEEDPTLSDSLVLTRNVTPSIEASLTVADVEIIDHTSLQAYLEKSIRIPLNVQSRLINNAVIKFFLKENNLLLHFHSLRSYFFLLNGEFAKSLTDSLYARLYEISLPIELFNSATLTNLLERALVNSFNNVYVNSELLSLSATDTPTHLHISDPNALDCLSLNYKISWPLNIILDETVMQQYGKVFKFLITSGRVSWVLQEDFNTMKRERKAAMSEQYHKLQLYRHSMTQFMNALHNYLTCSVLQASWAEFEKDLESSLTVDQIYLSHVNYLKRILSRCMLNARSEKMRICLNNIFKVILKFHNRLRSQSWTIKSTRYVHPNFRRLEQMYRAFCELRAYMTHVAFKLAVSGYQPHLMHFLNALNINQMYSLTVKTHHGEAPLNL